MLPKPYTKAYPSRDWLAIMYETVAGVTGTLHLPHAIRLSQVMNRRGAVKMPLLNRLKEYRAKLGVNQTEMGKLVGVSRQTISQIER